jgi:hypothetical protein
MKLGYNLVTNLLPIGQHLIGEQILFDNSIFYLYLVGNLLAVWIKWVKHKELKKKVESILNSAFEVWPQSPW